MSETNHYFKPVFHKIISCILATSMLFYSVGCKNYYLIEKVPDDSISEIKKFNDPQKSIVVHWYNSTYDLKEVTVDSTLCSGFLSLSENDFDYRYNTKSWNKKYKRADRDNINVVHIYLLYSHMRPETGFVKIDSKYISKIEIIKKNTAKTTMSHLLGWAGISLSVALIVGVAVSHPVYLNFPVPGL